MTPKCHRLDLVDTKLGENVKFTSFPAFIAQNKLYCRVNLFISMTRVQLFLCLSSFTKHTVGGGVSRDTVSSSRDRDLSRDTPDFIKQI